MSILKRGVPFTMVANSVLTSPDISLKAKGLFGLLFSKPDGWDFSTERIAKECKESVDTIKNTIKELELKGLVSRKKQPTGKMIYELSYTIDKTDKNNSTNPMWQNPTLPRISNTEELGINYINNKDILSGAKNAPIVYESDESDQTSKQQPKQQNKFNPVDRLLRPLSSEPEFKKQLSAVMAVSENKPLLRDSDSGKFGKIQPPPASKQSNEGIDSTPSDSSGSTGLISEIPPDLKSDKKAHIQIIGHYADYKNVKFENKKHQGSFIRRNARAATLLDSYPIPKILSTMEWIDKNVDFKWTLETVGKYIDEDLTKLENLSNRSKSDSDILSLIN